MEEQTRRQVQGAVELVRDAIGAGARSIGAAHEEIADIPYGVLRRVPLVSKPAGAIEHTQRRITRLVYWSVGAIASAAAAAATLLLRMGDTPEQAAATEPAPMSSQRYNSTTRPVRADS